LTTTEDVLLEKERLIWSSHQVPTADIAFTAVERERLRAMPEYVFVKEDPNFPTLKRALRHILVSVEKMMRDGITAYMEFLGQQLTNCRRSLRPTQVAEIQVLLSVICDEFSFPGIALAEYSILATTLLPASAFEQIRVARITRPENKRELDGWEKGAYVETRIRHLPVRFEHEGQAHTRSRTEEGTTERGRGRGRARGGN
jgi:hypothetical protein